MPDCSCRKHFLSSRLICPEKMISKPKFYIEVLQVSNCYLKQQENGQCQKVIKDNVK